jgi:hypothetical protein
MSHLENARRFIETLKDPIEDLTKDTVGGDVRWNINVNSSLNVYSKIEDLICFDFLIKKLKLDDVHMLVAFTTLNLSMNYGSIVFIPRGFKNIEVSYILQVSSEMVASESFDNLFRKVLAEIEMVLDSVREGEQMIKRQNDPPNLLDLDRLEELLDEDQN